MNRPLAITVIALVVLAGLGFGGRVYATHAMSARALRPKDLGAVTPAVAELPYSRIAVPVGKRTIVGWWVRADADSGKSAPAMLLLHGNHASISDLVPVQQFLYKQGISSLVFDYSGFGASGGDASLTTAVEDAGAVARVFADSAGRAARKTAFGSALGATVLLQAIDSVQPFVDGIVIEGVTASVKEAAVRDGRIPKLIAPLLADVGDNVAAARRVNVPLLAVHSFADNRFPFADAERVVAALPAQYSLVKHWRRGHSAILASSKPCDWAPILDFARTGALPTAKIDTTDVCTVEQLALQARRDSITAARQVEQAGRPARTGTTTSTKTSGTKTTTTKPSGPVATRPTAPRPTTGGTQPPPPTRTTGATGATGATGPTGTTKTYSRKTPVRPPATTHRRP
jgi:alpha-beta hydrolase superfamily lysophospholipase